MVINSDIQLKGLPWLTAANGYSRFFRKTNFSIFLLSTAIGIMYDLQIEKFDDEDEMISVPRNVFNPNSEPFDALFQSAILTTKLVDLSKEERLSLAFGDANNGFNKVQFLVSFANFGVNKLNELTDTDPVVTMENLKEFLASTVDGFNFEIDPLNDDLDYDIDQRE